jgi:hypothetical protein
MKIAVNAFQTSVGSLIHENLQVTDLITVSTTTLGVA